MAALWPDLLPGPGGTPILTAGYEGFTKGSWSELVSSSPMTAKYTLVRFRLVRRLQRGVRVDGNRYCCHSLPPRRAVGMVGPAGRKYDRTCVGHEIRLDCERHRPLRAVGISRPRYRLHRACGHSSIPPSGTASAISRLAPHLREESSAFSLRACDHLSRARARYGPRLHSQAPDRKVPP